MNSTQLIDDATLEQIIDRSPLIVEPDTLVSDAIALMNQVQGSNCELPNLQSSPNSSLSVLQRKNCVLVVEDSQLVGVFTERDVVKLTASRTSLIGVKIAEVMTRKLITLKQSQLQDTFTILSLLRQHQIRHLPIVDEQEQLIGLVTHSSIRSILQPCNLLKLKQVADVMTTGVIYAPLNTKLLELAQLMNTHRVSCVVIVEERGKSEETLEASPSLIPLGIVTEWDIVQFQVLQLDLVITEAQTVMSKPLFCLGTKDSLWFAHQSMQERYLQRLVVVGEQGELLGILTQTSLLAVFDPMEMSVVIEALQQQVETQTTELRQVNQKLHQEIATGQQIEETLRKAKNDLARRVDERTSELSLSYALLQKQIGAHQQAEAEIKFQATILDHVRDAVIVINNEHQITYWNQAAERLYNLKAEQVIGRRWEEAYQERWLKVEDEQVAQEALAATGVWWGEKIVVKKSGEELYVESAVSFLKNNNQEKIGLLSVIRDITQRKQTEDQIREQAALLDIATDAIFVTDLDDHILFWNIGAESLYSWQREEVLGKKISGFLYGKQTSWLEIQEARIELARTGKWQGELKQVTKEGKTLLIASRWTLVRDQEQQPKSILVVNTDITEKTQLETQFLHSQRLESLGTLAGGIAHELNNVLSPILLTAQLLKMKLSDENTQHKLQMIEKNAKRGSAMVKQVLAFARGMEGKQVPLQVGHILREIEQIAKQTFPKSIDIYTDIPTSNLWTVSADPTQLHQVFLNLSINARDAMPDGGTLRIFAENLIINENETKINIDAKPGPYVAVTVSDTGTGIPPEIIDLIFDPFFTTKEVGKGTGLGLSTTLGIVKNSWGFINVSSLMGKGSQFKVFLPAQPETTATLPAADVLNLPSGNGELILVVDDEPGICELTKIMLESFAYRVLTASNGIEAIATYTKNQHEISGV